LNAEPLFLFDGGVTTNGHYSGSLENVSGANTYTGTITLESNATIGVDGTSTLTITSPNPNTVRAITDLGNGPAGQFSLTKESPGTLILAATDNYEGGTFVNQGALNVQNSTALLAGKVIITGATWSAGVVSITAANTFSAGQTVVIAGVAPNGYNNGGLPVTVLSATSAGFTYALAVSPGGVGSGGTAIATSTTTTVLDQAQLQLQGGIKVVNQNLVVSGSGQSAAGAILNVSGNNTWGSAGNTVTFTSAPAF